MTQQPSGYEPPVLCISCRQPIGWIDCPTGGWWAHQQHPADGHDAQASLRDQLVTALVGDALKPRAERQGLVNVMLDLVQPELDQRDAEIDRLRAELQQAQQQLRLIDDEIEEFEAAAQSDPNTPASVLLMIQILRRIRPAAVSGA